jgi:5-formaminoimidazole-4-carboxamide-1-beta-D-ribofuranosyl 5'-monophosphate synthetase
MTLDERLKRGQAAERLIGDEMFKDAASTLSVAIKEEMFRTLAVETDKREQLYAEYKGFQRALERLNRWVDDGKMAADELARADKA